MRKTSLWTTKQGVLLHEREERTANEVMFPSGLTESFIIFLISYFLLLFPLASLFSLFSSVILIPCPFPGDTFIHLPSKHVSRKVLFHFSYFSFVILSIVSLFPFFAVSEVFLPSKVRVWSLCTSCFTLISLLDFFSDSMQVFLVCCCWCFYSVFLLVHFMYCCRLSSNSKDDIIRKRRR